jgi:NTE family protein
MFMAEKKLALVLSGGGARGAMQAGSLRALSEAGYKPDLWVGTSIGAANASFVCVHGYTSAGLDRLEQAWRAAMKQDLLPINVWWQLMRTLFRRRGGLSEERIREFAVANGITPELRFCDLKEAELYLVATDMNSGKPVIFGANPMDRLLDGLLASMALPPWVGPLETDGRYLVDGGLVSNLPIEAALRQGATEIIALNLFDPEDVDTSKHGLRPFLWRLDKTVEYRQLQLEMELAHARNVPVKHVSLTFDEYVPIWDFQRSAELITHGYQLTRQAITQWQSDEQAGDHLYGWLKKLAKIINKE